ncbi:hypothetical protein C0989_000692 [Termitomyces sp. Mn162]|nr:hypothetical protein C0989_000692 [Termitomyces sp. Mn162]
MAAKRTVLVLHGYLHFHGTTSNLLNLSQLLPKRFNLQQTVFIDAPHVLQPADLPGSSTALGALEATNAAADPTLTPRAWWKFYPDKTLSYGLSESLALIRDVMKTRRFDVSLFGQPAPELED